MRGAVAGGAALRPRELGRALEIALLLAAGLSLPLLVLGRVWGHSPLFFPLEDSYLYDTFGRFLSEGRFLTYSVAEPHANGNTSFLYYLIVGGIHRIARWAATNRSEEIALALRATFVLHAGLYCASLTYFWLVLRQAEADARARLSIVVLVFLNGSMVYAFFSGIEGPVTVFLFLLFFHGVTSGRERLELASLLLMAVNRPELALGAVIYGVLRFGLIAPRKRRWMAGLISAAAIVPLVNAAVTGSAMTSSIARTSARHVVDLPSLLVFLVSPEHWLPRLTTLLAMAAPWAPKLSVSPVILELLFKAAPVLLVATIVLGYGFLLRRKEYVFPAWTARVGLLISADALILIFLERFGEFSRYLVVLLPGLGLLMVPVAVANGAAEVWVRRIRRVVGPLLFLSAISAVTSLGGILTHIRDGTRFLRELHYQAVESLRANPRVHSVAIWETGVMSLFLSGDKRVIDIYGLGTARYARTPRWPLSKKARLMAVDRPDALVQWSQDPYQAALLNELEKLSIQHREIATFRMPPSFFLWREGYPRAMSIFELSYPEVRASGLSQARRVAALSE